MDFLRPSLLRPSSSEAPPSSPRPALVVFQAGVSASDTLLERLVAEAQNAATLDLLLTAAQTNAFHGAFLVTEDPTLATAASNLSLPSLPVHSEPAKKSKIQNPKSKIEGFHFGQNLLHICQEHRLERVVYVGGGAMPLATPGALADLALSVSGAGNAVVSNNLFSADLVAFYPASALERIDLPASDNDLAWLLHYRAGLPHAPTVKSLATHFDLDTPTDLAILRHSTLSAPLDRALGPHMAALLKRVPLELPALAANVERIYKVMATRRAQVFLAGRVSSWTWRRMEINLPCQTRILSEERGMRASGREFERRGPLPPRPLHRLGGHKRPHQRPRSHLRCRLPRHPRPVRPHGPEARAPGPLRLRRPPPLRNRGPLAPRADRSRLKRRHPHSAGRPFPHRGRYVGAVRAGERLGLVRGKLTVIPAGRYSPTNSESGSHSE